MQCRRCGVYNKPDAHYCVRCGDLFNVPPKQSGTITPQANPKFNPWIVLILAGFSLTVLIAIVAETNQRRQNREQPQTSTSAITSPAPAPTKSASQPATPPSEHLAEAKKAMADGYTPNGKYKSWGRVKDARQHLEQVQPGDKEYEQAQKLLTEVSRREAEIERWAKTYARQAYAETLEKTYLEQGMDVSVSLSGPDNTTIKLKYVLMSRPMVYKLTNDAEAMGRLRELGFKKAIFTDGYFHTWDYPL